MAQTPSPEESGRKILSIYEGDGIRANEMILGQALQTRFVSGMWRAVDFTTGLKWCIDQGYIEERKPNMYFLTDSGFEAL